MEMVKCHLDPCPFVYPQLVIRLYSNPVACVCQLSKRDGNGGRESTIGTLCWVECFGMWYRKRGTECRKWYQPVLLKVTTVVWVRDLRAVHMLNLESNKGKETWGGDWL